MGKAPPPGLGGKESPDSPPSPRAAPSCPPLPGPPPACGAPRSPRGSRAFLPSPTASPPPPAPTSRPPRARYLLVEAADHGLDPFHRPVRGHVLPATRGWRVAGWAGVRGPPQGGRPALRVKAAASRAAEECGQRAFPRGWGRGPEWPARRGTGEGGVGEEAGGRGGKGSPGRGGRLWVALPT